MWAHSHRVIAGQSRTGGMRDAAYGILPVKRTVIPSRIVGWICLTMSAVVAKGVTRTTWATPATTGGA
jgi:hypothetical protein